MAPKSYQEESKIQNIIFLIIVVIWAIAIIADIASTNFKVSESITAVVGTVVGYFTAKQIKQRRK